MLANKGKLQKEFDIVLVKGNSIALVEVKYKAHLSDVEQAQTQIELYRQMFPEHANFKVYSGIAGLNVPDDVVQEAHKQGLKQVGNVVQVDAQAMRAF